ncbi:MAG: hypothetical protein VSS75_017730 [Candidatus Parabeggiatoa sp.]|nr:hypothetical protein [Candidatus Parabeggiatoa sp.]
MNRLLEKCRRLWKNCERKLETSAQMVVLALYKKEGQWLVYIGSSYSLQSAEVLRRWAREHIVHDAYVNTK